MRTGETDGLRDDEENGDNGTEGEHGDTVHAPRGVLGAQGGAVRGRYSRRCVGLRRAHILRAHGELSVGAGAPVGHVLRRVLGVAATQGAAHALAVEDVHVAPHAALPAHAGAASGAPLLHQGAVQVHGRRVAAAAEGLAVDRGHAASPRRPARRSRLAAP